jgi:hypothetical protein
MVLRKKLESRYWDTIQVINIRQIINRKRLL